MTTPKFYQSSLEQEALILVLEWLDQELPEPGQEKFFEFTPERLQLFRRLVDGSITVTIRYNKTFEQPIEAPVFAEIEGAPV